MSIDFCVAAPSEQAARAIAEAATARGYAVDVSPDDDFEDEEDLEDEDLEDEEERDDEEGDDPDADSDDDGDEASDAGSWTCTCRRVMVASYEAIVAVEAELDALSEPHGGYTDGWGSFGNKG